jgi:hypothetical protein
MLAPIVITHLAFVKGKRNAFLPSNYQEGQPGKPFDQENTILCSLLSFAKEAEILPGRLFCAQHMPKQQPSLH